MIRKEQVLQDVVIKFAGDSGDGMQLTGTQFTNNTALLGIDLATFPDFPAEIRAPQGTLPGVGLCHRDNWPDAGSLYRNHRYWL